jgi:hypothetical protein
LLVGVAKQASHWITQLSHKLLRSGDVMDPDGPILLGGGAGAGGATMEGVDEVGGMVVLGVICP